MRKRLLIHNRFALPVGFLLALGLAFVPSGGCGAAHSVAEMPMRFAEPIRACAVMHDHHLTASEHTVKFDVGLLNGQVDSIVLVQSTLLDEELERCLATAIRSFTVDDIPLRGSANLERDLVQPESRELFGNPAVPLAACLASPPCLLGLVVVMGAAVITVQLTVYAATATRPATVTPTTTATPTPTTTTTTTATPKPTATPTTTAPPIPIPLSTTRYPNQTCSDAEMARLETDMHAICDKGFAATCPSANTLKRMREKGRSFDTPCSAVLLSIVQRKACLAARWTVQNICFGGKPDAMHKKPIEEHEQGVNNCEALKLIVCATGHPMAGK